MPTQVNRGGPGILAIPSRHYAAPKPNLFGGMEMSSRPLKSVRLGNVNTNLSGTTVNPALVFIPFCTVDLFNSNTNAWVARQTSDASGNFTFAGPGLGPFFIRAVDATGTPVGTTLNGLTAS